MTGKRLGESSAADSRTDPRVRGSAAAGGDTGTASAANTRAVADTNVMANTSAGANVDAPVGVVLVAAGRGTRLGAHEPKAFVPITGRAMLARAAEGVLASGLSPRLVVVVPRGEVRRARDVLDAELGRAITTKAASVVVVDGGAERQDSVAAGLAALPASVTTILVHDAARPFAPAELFVRVATEVARRGESVIPVLPVADTIKRLDDAGRVLGTVDRSELGAVQTPQGFPRGVLDAAYAVATDQHTDDAGLVAAAGGIVHTVAGASEAFKITTPADHERAERYCASVLSSSRTGIGVDVHAFDPAVPLWLGGLHWPDQPGLAGHSDGDAVSHAICDALLSAAGLGDIGSRFGTDDPQFRDARGAVFVSATVALLADAGWRIANVAVQVVANEPKIGPRRAEMERVLSAVVGAPVSVSGTTSDGLGATGRGEGLTAIVTALISR